MKVDRSVRSCTCVCGKRIFRSVKSAKVNIEKLKAVWPMWVYECRAAPNKSVFHITRNKGSAAMRVEAANNQGNSAAEGRPVSEANES